MCDTIVATAEATFDKSVILAKNSDREPNEAQLIEYHPPKKYKKSETMRCTYISIPQVAETRGVLISRPTWMWGAEIGSNDAGVAVGNEAVFTKLPMTKEKRLLGMDLLRLALERSDSAKAALAVICDLLEKYGQGGPGGFEDKKLVYHNSFIIADPTEAWVLETADREWVGQRVKGIRSISNGLTIGNRFDKASPNLIKTAIKRGWCSSEKDFDFADCYSDWFFTTFSMCRARKDRTTELLAAVAGKITPAYMMSFLRDHGDEGKGEFLPHKGLFMNKVCMHAANGLSRGSQSTASLVSHLTGGINTHWYTGTSAPCTSIFKPFYFESGALPDLGPEPKETYDEKTLWWRHERLHRATLLDYQNRMKLYAYKRDKIEGEFIDRSATLAKEVAKKGVDAAKKSLGEFSQKCFDATVKAEEEWTKKVLKAETPVMLPGLFSGYWKKQSRKAKMPE